MGLKICFISDPHTQHHEIKLPDGIDILICCGDISYSGQRHEVNDFLDWYSQQQARYKIFTAGNHDFWFHKGHPRNKSLRPDENPRDIIPEGIIYLENETIEIEGIKIFGSPWTPWFYSWAFNATRGDEIQKYWDLIQPDTDIVITHGPPSHTVLDRCMRGDRVGCENLSATLKKIQPKICAFGHIHEAYGVEDIELIDFDNYDAPGKIMRLINCSVLNLQYKMANEPVLVDWDEMCKLYKNKEDE